MMGSTNDANHDGSNDAGRKDDGKHDANDAQAG
jgi:hypothetical protein